MRYLLWKYGFSVEVVEDWVGISFQPLPEPIIENSFFGKNIEFDRENKGLIKLDRENKGVTDLILKTKELTSNGASS